MPTLAEQLATAGSNLYITGVPGSAAPGHHLSIGLAPALPTFTDIADLTFVAKQVAFSPPTKLTDPNFPGDETITAILPLYDLTKIPPKADATAVPGLIGRLKGFPISLSAKMEVIWEITDDSNNALTVGTDFLAPGGLSSPVLDVVFLPALSLFDGGSPETAVRKIKAHVKLTAGAGIPPATWEGDVGPAAVEVPEILFPKVLALTVDVDFQGPSLVMVPGPSAIIGIEHIKTLLQAVRSVISTLGGIARFAEMLTGIDTLSGVLAGTNVVFNKATTINNLWDITLVQTPWWEPNVRANDNLSAFVYLSPPPSPELPNDNKVEMCNKDNLLTNEGKFTVETGLSFVAICTSLNSAAPPVSPASAVSPPKLTVNVAPAGWRPVHNITIFGDELSSINFL
jgi:hypothetical protein